MTHDTSALGVSEQRDRGGAAPLDWSAFVERFFPGRRRHDLEALTAYAAHRASSVGADVGVPGGGAPALDAWESEGGATLPGASGGGVDQPRSGRTAATRSARRAVATQIEVSAAP
jgi:hypothetical protein